MVICFMLGSVFFSFFVLPRCDSFCKPIAFNDAALLCCELPWRFQNQYKKWGIEKAMATDKNGKSASYAL